VLAAELAPVAAELGECGIVRSQLIGVSQLEIGKVEAGSHGAAHQAPGTAFGGFSGKPVAGWHHVLGVFAAADLNP
jgi:hypothetical protein